MNAVLDINLGSKLSVVPILQRELSGLTGHLIFISESKKREEK